MISTFILISLNKLPATCLELDPEVLRGAVAHEHAEGDDDYYDEYDDQEDKDGHDDSDDDDDGEIDDDDDYDNDGDQGDDDDDYDLKARRKKERKDSLW